MHGDLSSTRFYRFECWFHAWTREIRSSSVYVENISGLTVHVDCFEALPRIRRRLDISWPGDSDVISGTFACRRPSVRVVCGVVFRGKSECDPCAGLLKRLRVFPGNCAGAAGSFVRFRAVPYSSQAPTVLPFSSARRRSRRGDWATLVGYDVLNGYFTSARVVRTSARPCYLPCNANNRCCRPRTACKRLFSPRPPAPLCPVHRARLTRRRVARVPRFVPCPPLVSERNKLRPDVRVADEPYPRHVLRNPLKKYRKTSG